MIDETVRRLVAAWFEREHEEAKRLVIDAQDADTVGEATEMAEEATRHLARADAFLAVLALIGWPEDGE